MRASANLRRMSKADAQENSRAIVDEISRRQVAVRTLPFEVQFSAEHRCNLRCIQCGATVERNHDIVPLMDRRLPIRALERFKKLASAQPVFEWLSLTGSGEPLIAPDFPAILELACGHHYTVAFNTNGTLWTREIAERVVDLGVTEVLFSIDGGCKETFERIRVNAKWEKVLDAVRMLVAVRREKGRSKPKIAFSSNFMRQNIEELPAIVDLAAELGAVKVVANNTMVYEPSMQHEALVHHRELAARMIREAMRRATARGITLVNQLHDLDDDVADGVAPGREGEATAVAPAAAEGTPRPLATAPPPPPATPAPATPAAVPTAAPSTAPPMPIAALAIPAASRAKPDAVKASLDVQSILPPLPGLPDHLPAIVHACQRPWTGLYVENNGWVKVCCFESPPIGNLDEQSLEEIWNGPLVQRMRQQFLDGKPPEACRNCFIFAKSQARKDVFVQEVGTGKSYVDSPGLDPRVSGVYPIHGWALEPDGVAGVEILIDGVSTGMTPCDQERHDVAKAYPGFPDGARCGFRFDLDTSRLSAGDHVLRLSVHTRGGRKCGGVERFIKVER
jgi:MoaA/NifB/PqqE/SkfB family radical SAM enzyme